VRWLELFLGVKLMRKAARTSSHLRQSYSDQRFSVQSIGIVGVRWLI
jgi:hypothetical protein